MKARKYSEYYNGVAPSESEAAAKIERIELHRKKKLQLRRDLHIERNGLAEQQKISRPFEFTYFEMIPGFNYQSTQKKNYIFK